MTRPNRLVEGLAHHLHEQQDFRLCRIMGRPTNEYLIYRKGSRQHELLADVIDEVSANIGVSPSLLLQALDTMTNSLPRRSIT